MVFTLVDITTNPIGFLAIYFFLGIGSEGIIGLLKLSLLTTAFIFPFVYIGKRYVTPKVQGSYFTKIVYTTVAMTVLFWLFFRLWYAVAGSAFVASDLGTLLGGIIISIIGGVISSFIGGYIMHKLKLRTTIPEPVLLLITTYVIILVIWALAWIKILISV